MIGLEENELSSTTPLLSDIRKYSSGCGDCRRYGDGGEGQSCDDSMTSSSESIYLDFHFKTVGY